MSAWAQLGLVALIFGGVVAVWKLLSWLYERLWLIALVGGGGYLLVRLVVQIAAEVFSIRGLLWSVGLGDSGGLEFPGIVRAVTLVGLVECAVLVSLLLDRRTPTGERRSWRLGYLLAHLTLLRRLIRTTVALVPLVRDCLASARDLGEELLERALGRLDRGHDAHAPEQRTDDEISDEDWRFGAAGQAI